MFASCTNVKLAGMEQSPHYTLLSLSFFVQKNKSQVKTTGTNNTAVGLRYKKKDHRKVAQYRVERMPTLNVGLKTIS